MIEIYFFLLKLWTFISFLVMSFITCILLQPTLSQILRNKYTGVLKDLKINCTCQYLPDRISFTYLLRMPNEYWIYLLKFNKNFIGTQEQKTLLTYLPHCIAVIFFYTFTSISNRCALLLTSAAKIVILFKIFS